MIFNLFVFIVFHDWQITEPVAKVTANAAECICH